MGSIYKITNTVNGKAYIGQTIQDAEKTRIRDHLTGNGNRILKNAVKKYGREAFTFEILHDGIIPEFLDTLEKEAIAKFNTLTPNGYNLRTGGGRGTSLSEKSRRKLSETMKEVMNRPEVRRKVSESQKGRVFSEEHRRKLSEAHKGKIILKKTRRKISEANKGRKHSQEFCRKISEAKKGENHHLYGKKLSESHRRKIGQAHKGKTVSEETRRKLSEAQETPERIAARDLFFSLPPDMDLKEKRRLLYQKITGVHRTTIYRWIREWTKIS